jgi:hypothetical protein
MVTGKLERFVVHPSVVFRELDGEVVLLHLDTGMYYGLDPVGTRVWALLVDHGSPAAVCERMLEEFDVLPEVVERDVLGLVDALRDKGLVAPAPEVQVGC